jgi:hypothetical protein
LGFFRHLDPHVAPLQQNPRYCCASNNPGRSCVLHRRQGLPYSNHFKLTSALQSSEALSLSDAFQPRPILVEKRLDQFSGHVEICLL